MTVLITGAAGLVGYAVRRCLEAEGVPVVPVDLEARTDDGVAQVVPCDVTDRGAVASLFEQHRVESVVHCGGISGPMVSVDDPRAIVNVGGTASVLDAARRARVSRFVYCSSIAAHGQTPSGPVSESVRLRPLDVYGATKASVSIWSPHSAPSTRCPVSRSGCPRCSAREDGPTVSSGHCCWTPRPVVGPR